MSPEFLSEKEKKVLELETRRKIYELVSRFAGSHFREIERRTRISTGSVSYHLDYLVKKNLIFCERDNNNLRYFPLSSDSMNKKIMSLLRQKSIRHIIIFLLEKDLSSEEIVNKTGLSASTVSWHLKKLEQEGVIKYEKKGRTKQYILLLNKEEILKLLIVYKESFFDKFVDNAVEMWCELL